MNYYFSSERISEIWTEGYSKANNRMVTFTFEYFQICKDILFEKCNYASGLFAWGIESTKTQPILHICVK